MIRARENTSGQLFLQGFTNKIVGNDFLAAGMIIPTRYQVTDSFAEIFDG